MISDTTFWVLTVLLGIGTFAIRFSFLGLLGGRELPDWAVLHLKYVGVAVFPALIAPLLLWPDATGGQTDPIRLFAAGAAFVAGLRLSVIWAIVAGMGTLYALQYLFTLV
ncbi:AzlD domain-containing protein [Arenibacterium sp. CAU 1754]